MTRDFSYDCIRDIPFKRESKQMNKTCARSFTRNSKSFMLWSITFMFEFSTEKESWMACFDFLTFKLVNIREGMVIFSKIELVSSVEIKASGS